MTEPTFEKMLLMLVATPGMIAPADTATKPGIRAYSIKSCPCVSFMIVNFNSKFFIWVTVLSDSVATLEALKQVQPFLTAKVVSSTCLGEIEREEAGPPLSLGCN